jgi:septal ring factor EnvC (AmiA/AmiB activator)
MNPYQRGRPAARIGGRVRREHRLQSAANVFEACNQRSEPMRAMRPMRAILCLGAMVFLSSCDSSKQQLATTQATLADVTKERDDLKSKVTTLQNELDATKVELAKEKSQVGQSGTLAAKTPENGKTAAAATGGKAKTKHAHKKS